MEEKEEAVKVKAMGHTDTGCPCEVAACCDLLTHEEAAAELMATRELLMVSQAELGKALEQLESLAEALLEAQSLLELVAVVLRKDPGFMTYAHQEIVRAVYAYVDKLQK